MVNRLCSRLQSVLNLVSLMLLLACLLSVDLTCSKRKNRQSGKLAHAVSLYDKAVPTCKALAGVCLTL